MLHIILLILKIIGILLLSVISLLILAILLVLFVPIRYRVKAEHGEAIWVDGRASWLLHLLRARISYMENTLDIRVKLLWFILYDSLAPKPPKDGRRKIRTATKSRSKEQTAGLMKRSGTQKNLERKAEQERIADQAKLSESEEQAKTEGVPEPERQTKTEKTSEPKEKAESERMGEPGKEAAQETDKSFIRRLFDKIVSILEKIKAFFRGLKEKFIRWLQTAANIKSKIRLISDFIKDEMNREGFKITYSSLKRLLKHILPRKLYSRIVFGTGDPCTTGQALGVMGILYSFYGDRVTIIPDFENKVLEGKHYARGRIRLITVLIIVIKLIEDKRFKQLKSNFQILKEAL